MNYQCRWILACLLNIFVGAVATPRVECAEEPAPNILFVICDDWRMLKEVGHTNVELLELQGYDHGGMAEPGFPLLLQFVKTWSHSVEAK